METAAFALATKRAVEPPDRFEAEAMAAESLLGSPRPDLPSRMQWLMTPLRRLILRCLRVFWVQQRAIDRALLGRDAHAAPRFARRDRTGGRRHGPPARGADRLSAEMRALRERIEDPRRAD